MADATMPGLPAARNLLVAEPDLLRALIEQTVNALLSEEADALCGAGWGERSEERVNRRNGYRERRWDTRAGTIDLQLPKLREGSFFPDWLLDRRRRAEKALISVVADLSSPASRRGGSRRRSSSSASRASARARCRGSARSSTSSSRPSGRDRLMARRIRS